ncbi:MAG: 6-bladed beta-propeller [Planctomycetota bacterium]|jgi:DNA-binding beta-propeller fold protein YncE
MVRIVHFIVLVGLIATASACHRPLRPIFDEPGPPITWPAEAGQARVRYVGRLASSADLKARRKPLQGIADFFVGAKPPQHLYGPRSVVTTGGGARVWIADPGGRCLHLFDLEGRSYKKIERVGDERLLSPSDACVGPDETIFVCDSEGGTIHQLSERTGELRRSLRLTDEVRRPVALRYDTTMNELWVVDVVAHNIKVLSSEGRLVRVIGRRGSGAGEFNYPCDIADDGTIIWVADAGNQRVQGLTRAGDPVVVFGEAGDSPGRMALPKGVATDSDGNVYVLDSRFENVQIFDRTGNLLLVVGEEGRGPGQFWLPAGIFVDPDDRIWVCDTYNRRVQVFDRVDDTRVGGGS